MKNTRNESSQMAHWTREDFGLFYKCGHQLSVRAKSSPSVRPYLLRQGRKKRNVILGDSNCSFRAVAQIIYGKEDNLAMECQILVIF